MGRSQYPQSDMLSVLKSSPFRPAGAVVADRAEQRAVLVGILPGGIEIVVNERTGPRMQPGVLDLQLAQLLAPQRVKQQRGQDGTVALDRPADRPQLQHVVGSGPQQRRGGRPPPRPARPASPGSRIAGIRSCTRAMESAIIRHKSALSRRPPACLRNPPGVIRH